jgi:probable F420-dependent oxidoreductase
MSRCRRADTVRTMQFSIWPSFVRPAAEILDLARWADTTGWHGVWFADHYMQNTDDLTVTDEPVVECWSMLAAIAATTTRVRLGPLVSPTTVHHPALLAKRACTIDHISGGRFVLGLGAGWQINEHHAYGIELPPPGERVTRFDEAIQIVRRLMSEPRVSFEGTWYHLVDAPCEPKPVQTPLPIMVGSGSPRMLRLTARWADEWNTWGDVAEVARRTDLFLRACEAERRDPATIRRSVQSMIFFADDPARADDLRARGVPDRTIVGSSAQIAEQIALLAELGADEFVLLDATLGRTPTARREAYERFFTEVAPAVN